MITQQTREIDVKEEINRLPYVFKDPVKFDKKVDPKKLRFGSKIDDSPDQKRDTYYSVKDILSPELLVLSNGLKLRLIGVKEKKEVNGAAVKFLSSKIKGEKVFMKYDAAKYDDEGNLLCYLYLKNKTFINAHLIKNGLVQVDNETEFKYKQKFITLLREANAQTQN